MLPIAISSDRALLRLIAGVMRIIWTKLYMEGNTSFVDNTGTQAAGEELHRELCVHLSSIIEVYGPENRQWCFESRQRSRSQYMSELVASVDSSSSWIPDVQEQIGRWVGSGSWCVKTSARAVISFVTVMAHKDVTKPRIVDARYGLYFCTLSHSPLIGVLFLQMMFGWQTF